MDIFGSEDLCQLPHVAKGGELKKELCLLADAITQTNVQKSSLTIQIWPYVIRPLNATMEAIQRG